MPFNRYGDSAKTLAMVSIILLVLFLIISVFSNAFTRSIMYFFLLPLPENIPSAVDLSLISSVSISIIWIVLNYLLVYRPISEMRYEESRNPCLALGILELFFGGFIPGILLLVAHSKLGDAIILEESFKREKVQQA